MECLRYFFMASGVRIPARERKYTKTGAQTNSAGQSDRAHSAHERNEIDAVDHFFTDGITAEKLNR